MKFSRFFKLKLKDQSGVVAVVVAISMVMLLSFAALAIDIGYLYATKNELQNVADAAALAAAGKLGDIYTTTADPLTYVCDRTNIVPSAQAVVGAGKNVAGGKNIIIRDADIYIDNLEDVKAAFPKYRFDTNDYNQPDAVRVVARRDSNANLRISTFFAGIFNINFLPVWADATAALTGQSTAGPGGLPLPVSINKEWMDTIPCNEDLTFNPSSADVCAAWHAYTKGNGYNPNANGMRTLIDDITDFTYESPETIAGVTQFDFSNGTISSIFTHDNFQNLFDDRKVRNDGILDMDTDGETWTLTVPIYDNSTGSKPCNPSGLVTIVGFASITITGVSGPPDKIVHATVVCDQVKPGRGGGSEYGTMGSIAGLVE